MGQGCPPSLQGQKHEEQQKTMTTLEGHRGWQPVRGQPDFYKQTEEKANGEENSTWDFIDVLP